MAQTNLENLTAMIDGLCHISAVTMKLGIAHWVDFFHNFFVGERVQPDHVADVFHELINGDAARVFGVGDAELCVEGVDGAFCKFCSKLDDKLTADINWMSLNGFHMWTECLFYMSSLNLCDSTKSLI